MTFEVMANRLGMTMVARTARIAAGTDQAAFSHAGFRHAVNRAGFNRAGFNLGVAMIRG
jgi:hypothetical protein